MSKIELRDVGDYIDDEGFDYFFNDYATLDSLPDEIKGEAEAYIEASRVLRKRLFSLGVIDYQ